MSFNQSYTQVQYEMDTTLIKNRREFAKRMYIAGMKYMQLRIIASMNHSQEFFTQIGNEAIAEESK